jgi:hypothetical protein
MPNKKATGFTYKVSHIDIDGDGIPDGDLIEKIDSKGVVVSRKFVSSDVLENIVSGVKSKSNQRDIKTVGKAKAPPKRINSEAPGLIVVPNKRMNAPVPPPPPPPGVNNQVMVADNTSFGSSLKQSFALGIGFTAGQMLTEGIAGLFG